MGNRAAILQQAMATTSTFRTLPEVLVEMKKLLSIREDWSKENVRLAVIETHREAVGRGDKLVEILERAIRSMEETQNRLLMMNTYFFVLGMVVLAAGFFMAIFGPEGREIWGTIFAGMGGLMGGIGIFYKNPLSAISHSLVQLVKLETAFLGYIRVIGEIDSAFQWQYLEAMTPGASIAISDVTADTTRQMKDIMSHTMELLHKYTAESIPQLDGDTPRTVGDS